MKVAMILQFILWTMIVKVDAQVSPILGFEIGYNIADLNAINNESVTLECDYKDSLAIQMKTGLKIGHLKVIGTYENTLVYLDIMDYNPLQDRYTVELTYDIGDFRIGFEHWCSHPVSSQHEDRRTFLNAGRERIYVNYYKEF